MSAPERIWAWDYDDCSNDNEDEWRLAIPIWGDDDPHPIDAVEYVRADLVAADAKAHEKEIAVWAENYAALERQLAEAREVKPLEWEPWLLGTSQAESVFGTYHTWSGYWRAPDATGRRADNPEAAAQADYTARILSALKETP